MTQVPGNVPGGAHEHGAAQPDPSYQAGPGQPPPAGEPGPQHAGQPPAPQPGAGQHSAPQYGGQQPGAGQHGAPQYGGQQPGGWQGGAAQPAGQPAATSIGLEPPIAGLLAYAFGWISGLIVLLVEKQNQQVRYHGAQSIAVFGGIALLGVLISILSFIPFGWIFGLLWIVLGPLALFLWIFLMIRAYQEVPVRIPLASGIADKIVGAMR